MKFKACSLPFLALLVACSSTPKHGEDPDWTKGPARTVDNGYIVYVASSDDENADRARFKAEGAAYQDLANECSFVPKGARLEDRFEKSDTSASHHAFAKVGIEFQLCEEAKKALAPDQVRKLANEPMTEQIKKYQEMIGETPDLDTPPLPDAPAAPDQEHNVTVIRDESHFFFVRQSIAYQKQAVILAPAQTYSNDSPATKKYLQFVEVPANQVGVYEKNNPVVAKSPETWSTTHKQERAKSLADPVLSNGNSAAKKAVRPPTNGKKGKAPQAYPKPPPKKAIKRKRHR